MEKILFEYHSLCFLCEQKIEQQNIRVNFQNNDLHIYKCLSCQVHFTNPAPVENDIPKLYEGRSESGVGFGKKQGLVYFIRKIRQQLNLKKIFHKIQKNDLKVLDFGCGDGIFALQLMKNKKCKEVTACDFFIDPPINLQQENIYVSNEHVFNHYKNTFDYIFLRHVLEHTKNPVEFIESISTLLSVDGRIIVEVPNYDSIWRKIFSNNYGMLTLPHHFFHFTKVAFKNIYSQSYELQFKVAHVPVLFRSIAEMFGKKDNGFSLTSAVLFPLQLVIDIILGSPSALLIIMQKK